MIHTHTLSSRDLARRVIHRERRRTVRPWVYLAAGALAGFSVALAALPAPADDRCPYDPGCWERPITLMRDEVTP